MRLGERVTHLPSGIGGVVVQIVGGQFTLDNSAFPGPYHWSDEWCASDSEDALMSAVVSAAVGLIRINKPATPATGYFNAYQDLERAVENLTRAAPHLVV